jgi:hypothetical protein
VRAERVADRGPVAPPALPAPVFAPPAPAAVFALPPAAIAPPPAGVPQPIGGVGVPPPPGSFALPGATPGSGMPAGAALGLPPAAGDTLTLGASLSDASRPKIKWNLNAQDQRLTSPDDVVLSDALSLAGLVDLAPSRSLNGTISVLSRREADRPASESVTINTGEVRGRYQPSDRLTINLKGSAEQRSRILRVTTGDPRLALLRQPFPPPRTLATERPVITWNASQVVDWQPSRRWDHRLSYRHRDESEVGTSRILSSNRAAGYRLKFAPGTVFRTTTEVEKGHAFSLAGALERDSWLIVQELLWSLASGLNLSVTLSDNDAKDRNGSGRDRTSQAAASAEKTLGRSFTGLARVARTRRVLGGRSIDRAVGAGLRYSPPRWNMRVQLDVEVAAVDGVDILGRRFESSRKKNGLRVDGRPVKDLNVEASLQHVKAGASAQGDAGYDAWTIESRAFVDF